MTQRGSGQGDACVQVQPLQGRSSPDAVSAMFTAATQPSVTVVPTASGLDLSAVPLMRALCVHACRDALLRPSGRRSFASLLTGVLPCCLHWCSAGAIQRSEPLTGSQDVEDGPVGDTARQRWPKAGQVHRASIQSTST